MIPTEWKYFIAEADIKSPLNIFKIQTENFNDLFGLQKLVQIFAEKLTEAM